MDRIGRDDIIEQLPSALRTFLSFERFHLHKPERFQNLQRDPSFDKRYLPQNCGAFPLTWYRVRRKDLYVYGDASRASLQLFEGTRPENCALFPVSPTEEPRCAYLLARTKAVQASSDEPPIWAVPTSSTRTLLAWPDCQPDKALFFKTSMHSDLFGDRHIYRHKVGASVGMSNLVEESLQALPSSLRYLFERVGYVPRCLPDTGIIVRSIPEEMMDNTAVLAPLFALIGSSGGRSPLLLEMSERGHVVDVQNFIEGVLCEEFAKLWLDLVFRFGIIIEPHGQNLLLELTPDLLPTGRLFYRDFEGLQIDWDLRRALGIGQPTELPHAWAWHRTYASWADYRYSQLAWQKLFISLYQYIHCVLNEIEGSLLGWQRQGRRLWRLFRDGDVGSLFSQSMFSAIGRMFGSGKRGAAVPENISHSLKQFTIHLMTLRKEVMTCADRSTARDRR